MFQTECNHKVPGYEARQTPGAANGPRGTGFVLEASVLAKKFSELRRDVVLAMTHYRGSGMGDCAVDEREDKSNKKYSSKFHGFCSGNLLLAYMYELFMPHNLLESSQASMPGKAAHSSDSRRTVSSQPGRRGEGGHGSHRMRLVEALERPVVISQTESQKERDFYDAKNAKTKALLAQSQLISSKEKELEEVSEKLENLHSACGSICS
jgi:hypothetical protein